MGKVNVEVSINYALAGVVGKKAAVKTLLFAGFGRIYGEQLLNKARFASYLLKFPAFFLLPKLPNMGNLGIKNMVFIS